MAHPEWAVKYRRPGTELRCIHGRYCLYECRSVYDKVKKRAVKKTGRYLGSITEDGGFKESRKRILERELEEARKPASEPQVPPLPPKVGAVRELGLSRFITDVLSDYVDSLRASFPDDWKRLAALAYCRLREQSPLKRVASDFGDSHLSTEYGTRGLSPNALSGFYHDFGRRRPDILEFLRKFGMDGDGVIFDGTDILSASCKMELPKMSKVKSGGFATAVNIMFGYTLGKGIANYYRLLPGNVKDIKAFGICAREYGCKDITAIIDKGFQSKANIEMLDGLDGIKFIMALKRNTEGLDYSPFTNRESLDELGHFWYAGRVIWYHKQQVMGHDTYLYLDERLRVEEQADYLGKADDPDNDHYSMESYREHVLQFGTIALMENAGNSAEKTYCKYKSRGEVEQSIDIFKNALEADTSYMQNEHALETWMFVNMIAMHWFCEIRQRMVDSKIIEKQSPMDMIKMMCRLRTVYVDGQWRTAEVTKKEAALLAAMGIDIT